MCINCLTGRFTADERTEYYARLAAPALAAIGPDAVRRAWRSLDDLARPTWNDCFLALAYGPPGSLVSRLQVAQAFESPVSPRMLTAQAAALLGCSADGALALVQLYDNQVPGGRARLRALCEEYLELNRTGRPTAALDAAVV